MELTRITRKWATLTFTATDASGDPVTVNDVAVALLSAGETPTAATAWTAVSNGADGYRVLLAGPDADSTSALVVADTSDLWGRVVDNPEVDAVCVERIDVL